MSPTRRMVRRKSRKNVKKTARKPSRQFTFEQLNIRFDERTIKRSGWARLRFPKDGLSHQVFCNLTVNNRWQVQNVLLIPHRGRCAMRSLAAPHGLPASMTIPLGTPDGELVKKIEYGLIFTPEPMAEAPPSSETALLKPSTYSINHNFIDTPVDYYPGQRLGGVFLSKGTPHGHPEIHNHPCGPNECVPNAVRLALEYMYIHFGLEGKGIPWSAF